MRLRSVTLVALFAALAAPLTAGGEVELSGGLGDTGGFRGAVRWAWEGGWGVVAEIDAVDYDDIMLFCCDTTYDRLEIALVHLWEESGLGVMAGWFDTTLESAGVGGFKLADSGFFGRAFYTIPLSEGGTTFQFGAGAFAYDGDVSGSLVGSRDGSGFLFDARLDTPMAEDWSGYALFASGWQPTDFDATPDSRIDIKPQVLEAGVRWQASDSILVFASWRQTDFRDDGGIGYDMSEAEGFWLGIVFGLGDA
ncbi:hypothetical protein IIA16_01125 [bacterium]|nr:hypothetical protein [bacterium]